MMIVKLCALLIFLKRVWAGVGPQSGYAYEGTGTAGQFDYRLQIYNNNYLTWDEDISDGVSRYVTAYIIDDKPYDVELWKDCSDPPPVAPTPNFPITFDTANNQNLLVGPGLNLAILYFIFDLNLIEASDLWHPSEDTPGDGQIKFCLRINNYIEDTWDTQINFLETQYNISSTLPKKTPTPSTKPSTFPSLAPSSGPTGIPSVDPSSVPSTFPSVKPSSKPSLAPSLLPSTLPSTKPSSVPSSEPSAFPSALPSSVPSSKPSIVPSAGPSSDPSTEPSLEPSLQPSFDPSAIPSHLPSVEPSLKPTSKPSNIPSSRPSLLPSAIPSALPSFIPSTAPSLAPSLAPSMKSSSFPSLEPSMKPSSLPSRTPSLKPSRQPSSYPSAVPTNVPTLSCQDFDGSFGANGKLTCAIIRKYKTQKRNRSCSKSNIYEICSKTCGGCCRDNPNFTFTYKSRERDCTWLATENSDSKIAKICEKKGNSLQYGCIQTCDACWPPPAP